MDKLIVIKGVPCPVEGCQRLMQESGTITVGSLLNLPPEKMTYYSCPEHGGRYFASGAFLVNYDDLED